MNSIKTRAGDNFLTEAEEKKLWRTINSRRGNKARRDFVLLKTARILGLRRAELVALNVGDIFGQERLVVNERIAKKGGTGVLMIPVELQDIFKGFCQKKRLWRESLNFDAPLFAGRGGGRLAPRTINDIVSFWCREAEIPAYTPHAFRHTKAQRIMADITHLGGDEAPKKLLFAQKQLRHRNIKSTAIYTGPTKEEMARVAGI